MTNQRLSIYAGIGICIASTFSAALGGDNRRIGGLSFGAVDQSLYFENPKVRAVPDVPLVKVPVAPDVTSRRYRDINESIAELDYQGRVFTNAFVTRISTNDAFVRIDVGVVRVQLKDLPEPARSKYLNAAKTIVYHEERAPAIKDPQDATLSAARKRRHLMAEDYPFRVLGSELYDLSDVIWAHRGSIGKDSTERYFISGHVLSIKNDCVIIHTDEGDGPFENVCLRNLPWSERLVDQARLKVAAIPVGRYSYISVLGAHRTVPLYDYGEAYTSTSQKKFLAAHRISAGGVEEAVVKFDPTWLLD